MNKTNEPIDYLTVMEQLRREEQDKRNQIHSPDFIPQEEAVVDYLAVSKAWEKTLQGRDVVNMPVQRGRD